MKSARYPMRYWELLRRLSRFGVREHSYRGKGSHRMVVRYDRSGKCGPKYTLTCHGEHTLITENIIRQCLQRLQFNKDEIEQFWRD
jgi:hypothetical protein